MYRLTWYERRGHARLDFFGFRRIFIIRLRIRAFSFCSRVCYRLTTCESRKASNAGELFGRKGGNCIRPISFMRFAEEKALAFFQTVSTPDVLRRSARLPVWCGSALPAQSETMMKKSADEGNN